MNLYQSHLIYKEITMKYQDLFAGRCTFTVSNNKNNHYTFRIDKIGKYSRYIVKLLTGKDNNKDYTYLGMMFSEDETPVRLTKASKFNNSSIPFRVFVFAQKVLSNHKTIPEGYSISPSGNCMRCGRKLTTPESIKTGYGPECIKRI